MSVPSSQSPLSTELRTASCEPRTAPRLFLREWVIPILTFAAITVWWLFPILSNLATVVPGTGAGDNLTFVWNVWWMRYVLHHPGHTFFFTPFLFHPVGVDLTLHTHTALPALVGAVSSTSPVAGQNGLIVLHIFLNFVCMYALAHRVTGHAVASAAAALIFGTSPFVSAHLLGHFNLIAAWALPLVCLSMLNVLDRPTAVRGLLLGLALAATAYTDYYLFVFAVGIVFLLWLSHIVAIHGEPLSPSIAAVQRRVRRILFSVLVLDVLVIAGIALFPGDRLDIGTIHISLRSVRNPITFGWILLVILSVTIVSGRVRLQRDAAKTTRPGRALVVAGVTTVLALMPLLIHAARLWRAGSYVSQVYLWRSGPSGIDVATLVVGHPFHAGWGDYVRRLYERLHIDVIESSAWIPVSAIALAAGAFVVRGRNRGLTPWVAIGTVFATWSLGPWLMVSGRQSPIILPAVLLRFLPIVSNARIPARAMIAVYLVVAMLAAMGFERLTAASRPAQRGAWCLLLVLILECIPARPALYAPDLPSSYRALREARKPGAVCELPLGLRDGFGETGSLDEAVLFHQTVHERPIVGGFIARLPPALARSYDTIPVIRSFLRLSSGGEVASEDIGLTPANAAAALASTGIAYVVLDRRRAGPELVRYVESGIMLRHMNEEDGRAFYEVPAGAKD